MNFRKKTIRDVELSGKTVLVRVDYNVPMKDGKITNALRLESSAKTINYLLDNGAEKVILISHLGRPDGEFVPEMSLAPVAEYLNKYIFTGENEHEVAFVQSTTGNEVAEAVAKMPHGGILLLENLRFSPLEKKNSEDFARDIVKATGADLFVQDGFAVVHRAHASTDAIARLIPAVAGFLLEKEIVSLDRAMRNPEHPVLVMIGGAKVADKQPLIDNFLPIADNIVVGGKIAADGYSSDNAKVYVAEDFREDEDGRRLDIGDCSAAHIVELIKKAKTIIWNGTFGMTEDARFAASSRMAAEAMGERAQDEVFSVIGGGDTAGFVKNLCADPRYMHLKFGHISTGGGASLEYLSGKSLPGYEVLQDKES